MTKTTLTKPENIAQFNINGIRFNYNEVLTNESKWQLFKIYAEELGHICLCLSVEGKLSEEHSELFEIAYKRYSNIDGSVNCSWKDAYFIFATILIEHYVAMYPLKRFILESPVVFGSWQNNSRSFAAPLTSYTVNTKLCESSISEKVMRLKIGEFVIRLTFSNQGCLFRCKIFDQNSILFDQKGNDPNILIKRALFELVQNHA